MPTGGDCRAMQTLASLRVGIAQSLVSVSKPSKNSSSQPTHPACCSPCTFLSLPVCLQVWAYYGGMLAYYWLLATPAMGFVFGLYLYISVCWFHVHYDEVGGTRWWGC